MVVAGRVLSGDVAIMMVEAGATERAWGLIAEGAVAPTEAVVAQGLEAAKPHIKAPSRPRWRSPRTPPGPPPSSRSSWTTPTRYDAVEQAATAHDLAGAIATEGKHERDEAIEAVRLRPWRTWPSASAPRRTSRPSRRPSGP